MKIEHIEAVARSMPRQPWGIGSRLPDVVEFGKALLDLNDRLTGSTQSQASVIIESDEHPDLIDTTKRIDSEPLALIASCELTTPEAHVKSDIKS